MNTDTRIHNLQLGVIVRELNELQEYMEPIKEKLREHYPDLRYLPVIQGLASSLQRLEQEVVPYYDENISYRSELQKIANYLQYLLDDKDKEEREKNSKIT